ncbi:FAD-dependent monooxygenase [Streptomyces sp. NPDC006879]|uniref:FAD-dependent monooxygenase n=1 Tax=Streptomyces sp. NPDC006879 TaxID=3364767 RepID=UPI00369CE06E
MFQRHAVVAGAGIGGLTAAVALHRQGWRVTVCERAPRLSAHGAGIILAPNALRALDAIGLGAADWAGDASPAALGLRRPSGTWLSRADAAALTARYGRPPLAVYRPTLTAALARALPDGALRHNARVLSVTEPPAARQPTVVHTTAGDLKADVVLAADGIHSVLRRQCFPSHPGLRHSGETAWRAVVDGTGLPPYPAAETWGRGERFGVVPLADGRIYVYATALAPAGYRPADARRELRRRFAAWHQPIPQLLERIDALEPASVLQHDLYDLALPLNRFHRRHVALLGDAAHAMTPNLGQGGCLAMEDAVELAHLLASEHDVLTALSDYTRARRARVNAILLRARRAGRVAAVTNPVAASARDLLLRTTPGVVVRRALDALLEWTPPGTAGAPPAPR